MHPSVRSSSGGRIIILSPFFGSPENVFTYLSENISQVIMNNENYYFNYASGQILQNREVVVKLVKEEVEDNAIAHLMIANIKEYFAAQL